MAPARRAEAGRPASRGTSIGQVTLRPATLYQGGLCVVLVAAQLAVPHSAAAEPPFPIARETLAPQGQGGGPGGGQGLGQGLGQGQNFGQGFTNQGLTRGDAQPRLGGFAGGGYDIFGAPIVPPAGGVVEPGWTLRPSIGVQFLGTDNIDNTTTRRRGEFITTITPGLAVYANTNTVTGYLNYSPSAWLYADRPRDNRLDQRYLGQALVTLMPELLYLDLSGFGAMTETAGGNAPGGFQQTGSPVVNRGSLVQTTSLQASPYIVRRLGNFATMQLGYGWRYLSQDGNTARVAGAAQPFFTSEQTTTHEGFGIIRTGDYFGRLAFESRTIATVYDSNGALAGAHRYSSSIQARYGITRSLAGLLEGGYEDQKYGGTAPFSIQGPIWSVGLRFMPDPQNIAIIKYGRHDGFNSASGNVSLSLGGRTRLFASYADELGTPAQRTADLLSTTTIDPLGNTIDAASGTPARALPFTNSFLATQNSLFRLKRASVALSQGWERDSFELALLFDDRRPLTSAIGTTGFAQKGTSVSVSWTHRLTEAITGTAYLQYGVFDGAPVGGLGGGPRGSSGGSTSSDVYTLRLAFNQVLTETLSASLQYAFSNRGTDNLSSRTTQNIVIAGLRKTF